MKLQQNLFDNLVAKQPGYLDYTQVFSRIFQISPTFFWFKCTFFLELSIFSYFSFKKIGRNLKKDYIHLLFG